jgi:hypothetical protein
VIRIEVLSWAVAAGLGITDNPTPRKGLATSGLSVAGCFLDELHARAQAEFGVDVGQVGLHRAR